MSRTEQQPFAQLERRRDELTARYDQLLDEIGGDGDAYIAHLDEIEQVSRHLWAIWDELC